MSKKIKTVKDTTIETLEGFKKEFPKIADLKKSDKYKGFISSKLNSVELENIDTIVKMVYDGQSAESIRYFINLKMNEKINDVFKDDDADSESNDPIYIHSIGKVVETEGVSVMIGEDDGAAGTEPSSSSDDTPDIVNYVFNAVQEDMKRMQEAIDAAAIEAEAEKAKKDAEEDESDTEEAEDTNDTDIDEVDEEDDNTDADETTDDEDDDDNNEEAPVQKVREPIIVENVWDKNVEIIKGIIRTELKAYLKPDQITDEGVDNIFNRFARMHNYIRKYRYNDFTEKDARDVRLSVNMGFTRPMFRKLLIEDILCA